MSKKLAALALAVIVVCSHAVHAQDAAPSKEAQEAAKAKAKIEKMGEGERVEVKLCDGTEVKGLVGELADDHFTVVDRKTGAETTVKYDQVKFVQNRFIPKRMKVASLVILAAVTPVFVAAAGRPSEGRPVAPAPHARTDARAARGVNHDAARGGFASARLRARHTKVRSG